MKATIAALLAALAVAPAALADAPAPPWYAMPAAALAGTAPWCGTTEAGADLPDAVGGPQVHVVYAYASDGTDHFQSLVGPIVSDLQDIDAWWQGQDPTRTPRFDLAAFPGCSGLGALDISVVRLPSTSAQLQPVAIRYGLIQSGLASAGFTHPFKKYLVYYDGPQELGSVCGQSPSLPDRGGGDAVAAIYLQDGCGSLGNGQWEAITAADELVQNLGAVLPEAPHNCPANPGHVCDASNDLMYGLSSYPIDLADRVLDVGHDDYYAHSGSWFDVQDSLWLRHLDGPQHTLTVDLVGAGKGDAVTSDVPGIACPPTCSTTLDAGSEVTLDAEPGSGRTWLVRWGGDCSGRDECSPSMDADRTVRAVFGPSSFRIGVHVTGRGRVWTEGLTCTRTCSTTLPAGSVFVFHARAAKGWRLAGWGGTCRGRQPTCRVPVTAARQVAAAFKRLKRPR